MQVLQMKRRLLSNTAIHLSRHRKAICLIQSSLRPGDGERSKDVSSLMGTSKAALRGRSQEATVGGWLKSARQSGSSDGLRVSVI
jgi:hypothetical protein